MSKTILEIIQAEIDACNHHNGCNKYCSLKFQETCPKLVAHRERMAECRKNNLPIEFW